MANAVRFPTRQPEGYTWIDDEPLFDPSIHLELEQPSEIVLLSDLGYDDAEIERTATPVALSSPFRVLSAEGVEVLLHVARLLRPYARRSGGRIERAVRGGSYRSRWLRDLCTSPAVTEHLSEIYGVDVAPHAMPLQLGHMNYDPSNIDTAIDKWHVDTLALDYVMMVTDPALVDGGRFEYFNGTKHEAEELKMQGRTPPSDRTVQPAFPGPGYAVAMHGNMVVHRAGPMFSPGERITMVNGYVSLDTSIDAQSRSADLITHDEPHVLFPEWARMAAWRSGDRLEALVAKLGFTPDTDAVIGALEFAIEDVQQAIDAMRAGAPEMEHFGG